MPFAFAYAAHLGADETYLTIDRQKQKVESYYSAFLRDNLRWAGTYIDGDSQRLPLFDREAGGVLIDRTNRGDHVLLASIRISFYSNSDLIHLLDYARSKGIALHFVEESIRTDDGDPARLLANMLHELQQVSDEPRRRAIRAGLAKRRERGLPANGEAGLGFKLVGRGKTQRLVPDEEERSQMQQIFEWRMQGMSVEEIYVRMREQGFTYRRRARGRWVAREWSRSRIARAFEVWRVIMAAENRAEELVATG